MIRELRSHVPCGTAKKKKKNHQEFEKFGLKMARLILSQRDMLIN